MALVQSNNNNSSDNCEQTFTYTSSASTIPGTSTSPPAIAPTSQLTFDALESTAGQHLYEDQQPLMALSSASIGATNEGSMPNNTIEHRKHTILFNVASLTTDMYYKNTQMKWTNRMFSEANILSTKKTHAGRKAGAQMAEFQGNRDEMTSCYLTSIPFKWDFYIARTQINPPLELQKKNFPTKLT
ncbi:hypothetical protein V1522DRAFT_410173 [Lipomyces starkeyi]